MSGCQLDLTENIKQEQPYSLKQWHCLIDNINQFLTCGNTSGCGNYPLIEKPAAPTMWLVLQVHETLRQINPTTMGNRPERWSRDWLNRVVQTLREGWPNCAGGSDCSQVRNLNFIGTAPYEIHLQKPYVEFATYVRHEYRDNTFTTPKPINAYTYFDSYKPDSAGGQSKWYKRTTDQLVDYTELIEDDFFYTDQDDQTTSRFPESSQIQDDIILAAKHTMNTEPTEEAYNALNQLSPHACDYTYIEVVPAYLPWREESYAYPRGSWQTICPREINTRQVRVPTKFQFQSPGEEEPIIYTMAYAAQVFWALRLMHIEHKYEWNLDPSIPTFYRQSYLENNGLPRGGTTGYDHSTFWCWTVQQAQIRARAWMQSGKILRYDTCSWTQTLQVPLPNTHWDEAVIHQASGTSAPCDDDWHY